LTRVLIGCLTQTGAVMELIVVKRVKNTFLEFTEVQDGFDSCLDELEMQTTISAPPLSRSSSFGNFPCMEHLRPTVEDPFEHDLEPSVHTAKLDQKHQDTTKERQKHSRPSRNKRHRFRQYVDTLKVQLEKQPHVFDCRKIVHPPTIIRDKQTLHKVESILERHRAQILTRCPHAADCVNS